MRFRMRLLTETVTRYGNTLQGEALLSYRPGPLDLLRFRLFKAGQGPYTVRMQVSFPIPPGGAFHERSL